VCAPTWVSSCVYNCKHFRPEHSHTTSFRCHLELTVKSILRPGPPRECPALAMMLSGWALGTSPLPTGEWGRKEVIREEGRAPDWDLGG
jgi:hypothetical protein